jgi:hypothetical protein
VLLEALDNQVPEHAADEVISTAHRSKGREWSSVSLADDFPDPDERDLSDEEMRLLYVAATRAQHALDVSGVALLRDAEIHHCQVPAEPSEGQRSQGSECEHDRQGRTDGVRFLACVDQGDRWAPDRAHHAGGSRSDTGADFRGPAPVDVIPGSDDHDRSEHDTTDEQIEDALCGDPEQEHSDECARDSSTDDPTDSCEIHRVSLPNNHRNGQRKGHQQLRHRCKIGMQQ